MRTCSPPIAVVATSAGWKGIPWLRWTRNGLFPFLALDEDRILYRVTRTCSKPYHAVARVDYRGAVATADVVISFSGGFATFVADTGSEASARELVRTLAGKGCPLSPRAARLAGLQPAMSRSSSAR